MAEEFTCNVDHEYRSACAGGQYRNTGYCVPHYPGEEKNKEVFLKVKQSKLHGKDYDFAGHVFPEGTSNFGSFVFDANAYFAGATFIGDAIFVRAQFSGERTSFQGAKFGGEVTSFEEAKFSATETHFEGAEFFSRQRTDFAFANFSRRWTSFSDCHFCSKETSFSDTQFSSSAGTNFSRTKFSSERTDFSKARFGGEKTDFLRAEFGGAATYFQEATFMNELVFSEATFKERASFLGSMTNQVFDSPRAWLRLDRTRIENPDLLTFRTVLLRPSWFINTDVRKVDFTDVMWYGMPNGPRSTLGGEIDALNRHIRESPHTRLAQACRRLSANAEENREYPLANEFYYWSMDALRKEPGYHLGLIGTLYWALSGYGVRAARAFLVLLGMWAVFVCLYLVTCSIEHVGQASLYSLAAMVRLTGIPAMAQLTKQLQPSVPGLFQLLVTVEGILGPLQIALLALAIRRQVMR